MKGGIGDHAADCEECDAGIECGGDREFFIGTFFVIAAELEHHGVDLSRACAGPVVGDEIFGEGGDLAEYVGGVFALFKDGLDLLVAALEGSGLGSFCGL